MAIFGIGVDLCEIARVEKLYLRQPQAFAAKILHPNEQQLLARSKFPERFLAKRFAAKEAFAKAMGTGVAEGIILPDIEVANDIVGKPFIIPHGGSLQRINQLGRWQIHLSISDEKHYAVAQVLIEVL